MEPANPQKKAMVAAGELVLQNGRQIGTRRLLGNPTTFIGRGHDCDIRLNVEGIDALHCLLVLGRDGVQIRDLKSAQGTFVNGVRTEQLLLQDGDVLNIGPFQFRLDLTMAPPASSDLERDALRIQAAAVAAQQFALEEEETRLQKRKADLEQQEEQLAAHLAEKQRQVELWSEQARADQESLRVDKLELEKKKAAALEEQAQAKEALARDHQKLNTERQRVNTVYQRLRRRWQKHWSAEREKYQRLAGQLEAERRAMEQKQIVCRERDAALSQEILRFNTDRELYTRQIRDERAELKKDQETWRKRRSLEMSALTAREQGIEEVQLKISQARQLLGQEKAAWQRQRDLLEKELYGLNNRVVNQRIRMQEQEDQLARLDAQRRDRLQLAASDGVLDAILVECDVEIIPDEATPADAPPPTNWEPRIAELAQLAIDLADQRVALVEQYQRLAEIHETWHEDRVRAAADLDVLAQRLLAEEEDLKGRQSQVAVDEMSLRRRQAEIEAVRQEIAIGQAQMKAREQTIKDEHASEMAALRQKETLLGEQLASLAQVRLRWNARRQEEISQIQASRAALAREQAEMHTRRADLSTTSLQIAEDKRQLAEKSLALEQYRQEVSLRAKDPAAQRRVERLRRRWLARNAALVVNTKNERAAARKDLDRLEERRVHLLEQLSRLTHDETGLAEKQSMLDEREAILKAKQIYLDDEIRKLEYQKKESQRQHLRMHEDSEAVAQVMFEDDVPPPADKAA